MDKHFCISTCGSSGWLKRRPPQGHDHVLNTGGSSMNIDTFLVQAKEKNASDVHLSVNAPVMYRINGELEPAGEPLSPDDLDAMARSISHTASAASRATA